MSEKFPLSNGSRTPEKAETPYELFLSFAEHDERYAKVTAALMREFKHALEQSRLGKFKDVDLELPVGLHPEHAEDLEHAEEYVYSYPADNEPEGVKIIMEATKKFTNAQMTPDSYRKRYIKEAGHEVDSTETWQGKLPDAQGNLTDTDVYFVIEEKDGLKSWRMKSESPAAEIRQAA